ncbi:MAG: ATP-binding cassette domain-containing protein [Chitinophagaceae bacterium]|nr:ATP-binding cassette domain-containing protein [Chitinophagaceae bacterium]
MSAVKHIAIYLPANTDKHRFIAELQKDDFLLSRFGLKGPNGAIFSETSLDDYMNEEFLHGRTDFDTGYNRQLHAMSSGEQKKAFLNYLLERNPDYLILDSLYDHLDIASQEKLKTNLTEVAANKTIIQIIHRRKELLPFMKQFYSFIENELLQHQDEGALVRKMEELLILPFDTALPQPLHKIHLPKDCLIEMKNLSVQYNGQPILQSINWQIRAGEFWQLVGPNGSGKSTLLSLIAGDNPKGYGQDLFLFGKKKGSGETVWEIKQFIGYFNANIVQHFSRLDSIEKMIVGGFFDSIGLYIKPSDQQMRLAGEWLQFIGLYEQRNKAIQFLPLAQQRMVLIARAMVKHPPLLILDEPTAGLDDASAALIIKMIQEIAAESKSAILYVSHSKEEGIFPDKIMELHPSENGSSGKILIPQK